MQRHEHSGEFDFYGRIVYAITQLILPKPKITNLLMTIRNIVQQKTKHKRLLKDKYNENYPAIKFKLSAIEITVFGGAVTLY